MIKNQVYAGIALALIGLLLFVILSPILYYESPIGIHIVNSSQGDFQIAANQTMTLPVNATTPYLVVGYNYTVSPIVVQLENQSSSIQPFSVKQSNHTVSFYYQFKPSNKTSYTLTFHNNATQAQTIYYGIVGIRFGDLPLYVALNYLELALFLGGIVVAILGAFRRPPKTTHQQVRSQ